MVQEITKKFSQNIRQFGFLNALRLMLRYRFDYLWMCQVHDVLFLQKLMEKPEEVKKQLQAIQVHSSNSSDVEKVLGRELHSNEVIFIACEDNEVTGYAISQRGGRYRLPGNFDIDLPNHAILWKNLYVDPAHRGKRIGLILNYARANHATESGLANYVFVFTENIIAKRNLYKVGFKDYGSLQCSSFLRNKRIKFKSKNFVSGNHNWLNGFIDDGKDNE